MDLQRSCQEIAKELEQREYCLQCGEKYKPFNSKSKYCSAKCRTNAYLLRKKINPNIRKGVGSSRLLGSPLTVGELRELIKDYPDDTQFGFNNGLPQPIHEISYSGSIMVAFQWITERSRH